jgi:predicted small metal-binding protein
MSAPDATPRKLEFHHVLDCPCGRILTGDTEDEIVERAQAHLREQHPQLADSYEREMILFMTRLLVKPPADPGGDERTGSLPGA